MGTTVGTWQEAIFQGYQPARRAETTVRHALVRHTLKPTLDARGAEAAPEAGVRERL